MSSSLAYAADNSDSDADIEDLISSADDVDTGKAPMPTTTTKTSASASASGPKYSQYYIQKPSIPCGLCQIPTLLTYMCVSFMVERPCLSKITTLIVFGFMCYGAIYVTSSKTETIGVIKYNFDTIHSQYDFKLGDIDHWCIDNSDQCRCEDPLQPSARPHKNWFKAHMKYVRKIQEIQTSAAPIIVLPAMEGEEEEAYNATISEAGEVDAGTANKIDVAIVGQSIVEVLNGFLKGSDRREETYFGKVNSIFQKNFENSEKYTTAPEKEVRGIAMGLTGDQSNHVLWRLMHGELGDDEFDPPIWWIVVGMEDVGRFECSEEVVVMGILRIVEEILKQKPNAKIVVNSLFPMTKLRDDAEEVVEDVEFIDAERNHEEGGHGGRRRRRRRRLLTDIEKEEKVKAKEEMAAIHEKMRAIKDSDESKEWKQAEFKKLRGKLHRLSDASKERMKAMKDYEKDVKHDKSNPVMSEKHKFKVNRFRRKKKAKIPVWTAVSAINKELHKFCQRTERVTFYDSTRLFAEQDNAGQYVLNTDSISPRGHPTIAGFKQWMVAVKQQTLIWKKKIAEAEKTGKFAGDEFEDVYGDNGRFHYYDSEDIDEDKLVSFGHESLVIIDDDEG